MHRVAFTPIVLRATGVLVLLALTACATPAPPPPAPSVGQPYRVGPPDRLRLTILPEPEVLREVVVRPDGMISVDLIGDVPASGRTVEEIAGDIERRIGKYKRDARASVALMASLSSQVTVLGEVGRPATFPLERETRVVEALGLVGGPSLFAAKTRIRVIRLGEAAPAVYTVDLSAIQRGDLSTNLTLSGGDIVYVPPSRWAAVGYAMQSVLFPFQQLFGFGTRITTTVVSGGTL